MKLKLIGAAIIVLLGAGLLFVKQPGLEAKLARIQPDLNRQLQTREAHLDPAELLDVMNQFALGLEILDVRSEADYNRFHIIGAQRVTMDQIRDPLWARQLPAKSVIVLVSNDEQAATQAWKLLNAQGAPNLYILEGGVNFWLDIYGEADHEKAVSLKYKPGAGDDTLRHEFEFALGDQQVESNPDYAHKADRKYKKKIKLQGASGPSGGCG
jgi:rhodanese-related sulfurtransferase